MRRKYNGAKCSTEDADVRSSDAKYVVEERSSSGEAKGEPNVERLEVRMLA